MKTVTKLRKVSDNCDVFDLKIFNDYFAGFRFKYFLFFNFSGR
jgi:hypothetical protein